MRPLVGRSTKAVGRPTSTLHRGANHDLTGIIYLMPPAEFFLAL